MIRSFIVIASLVATSAVAQSPAAPPSSADLALGTDIAAKLLPDGTYQRIMSRTMATIMDSITNQMTEMPLAPFLKSAGVPASDTSKLGHATIKQIMDIVDPAYHERMQAIMPAIMSEMGKIMTQFEPDMRKGLAQAYAARFSGAQLGDIDRFLNTPSGLAFAAQNMTISSDPAVMQKMQAFMPTLMKSMPSIMEKAMASVANLPKPKTYATLSDADRVKLAQLLGAPADRLNKTFDNAAVGSSSMKLQPGAKPTPAQNFAQFFGPDDYPPEALRAESQGSVVAALAVNPQGRVTSCMIQSSSGSGVLDAATCAIATNRFFFNPATDKNSKPIAGQFRLPVRWVLPKNLPVVVPNPVVETKADGN